MVDLSKLPPSEFAAQLARPTGETGVAVGDYMADLNRRLVLATYARLGLAGGASLLEVGFGNGRLIRDLLALTPGLRYAGVEVSEVMLAAARAHNADLEAEGRLALRLAAVESLPLPDRCFDGALAVNTIYFWPNQAAGLREIGRVLKPGGALALASMTPETSAKSPTARPEYGFRVPDRATLVTLHREAGFGEVECELYAERNKRLDGTVFERTYHIVLARR